MVLSSYGGETAIVFCITPLPIEISTGNAGNPLLFLFANPCCLLPFDHSHPTDVVRHLIMVLVCTFLVGSDINVHRSVDLL